MDYKMDLSRDFNYQTLELLPDYEGQVSSTLISSKFNTGNRRSILYLHGYIDYFFHPHMAEKFNQHGVDFYALDLRKYGRSIMASQHPNYCRDMQEYFEEITLAIQQIKAAAGAPIYLLGHSTGGLLASIYMNSGKQRSSIDKLLLNSPFLEFNQPPIARKATLIAARIISTFAAYSGVKGALSPAYPESIHKNFHGEWDFNLEWKPIAGFPTYFKWMLAVARAQKELLKSDIKTPVLVMHSSQSKNISNFTKEAMSADIVLNIEDIKRIGAQLGKQVTLMEIENAQHDIFLSPKKVRDRAFQKMFAWLGIDNT